MKVLVTSDPPVGHVRPLLPVVDALLERGHLVHAWTSESALQHFADSRIAKHRRPDDSAEGGRVELAVRSYEALAPVIAQVQPDLLVHEGSERGAELHAAVTGLPSLSVLTSSDSVLARVVALQHEVLEAASAALGLRNVWKSRRQTHPPRITYLPPVYHQPTGSRDLARNVEFRRYRFNKQSPGPSRSTDRRRILVTFGTTGRVPHRRVIEHALTQLPLHEIDVEVACPPALTTELAERFPAAEILGFTSIIDRLPAVDLLVTHGGASTATEALFLGVPLHLTPFRGDQFYTAERCGFHHVGSVFNWTGDGDGSAFGKSILGALEDPSLRENAQSLSRTMRALPSLTELVDRVETELG